jgi:site-specific DNA-cytosine methylase
MCAGYGGIGLGIKNIFGERLRTIAYCELEGFAQANLISKMEKGLLDAAPIWSDLKTFPYESFHGLVDIIIAGYPCQPFSSAGKRAGKEDPRHLWPWIADGIRLLQPTMCFFENVEGHISLGLSTVISDLEELGYKVSWGIFSASECLDASGRTAPHQRKRVFIMAHRKNERFISLSPERWEGQDREKRTEIWDKSIGQSDCGTELANSYIKGLEGAAGKSLQGGIYGFASNGATEWPSRPGQQQYAWEPPRVVGNSKYSGLATKQVIRSDEASSDDWRTQEQEQTRQSSGADRPINVPSIQGSPDGGESEAVGNTDHGRLASGLNAGSGAEADRGGQGDIEQADSGAMGNSSQLFSDGSDNNSRISERSKEISKFGNAGWNELGNSECLCIPASREHGTMDEASGIPTDRKGSEPAQTDPESSATREREGDGGNAAECSKIKCEMGRDAYGTEFGMDLSELSGISHQELAEICEWMVKTESRTDELRLLGNGVVPATATRAFLTLMEELNK